MDASGNTVQVFRHDITNDELEDLIHQIKSGRGLMFDIDAWILKYQILKPDAKLVCHPL